MNARNARYRGTGQASYQINKTRDGVILRDEKGVRKVSDDEALSVRHQCIEEGFAVWAASQRVEHYLKPIAVPECHEVKPVYEIEVFDFRNEDYLIVRFALRSSVYLLRETVTVRVSRGTRYTRVIRRHGFQSVKVTGKLSSKKDGYKLFRSNLDVFPNLSKSMAKKTFDGR